MKARIYLYSNFGLAFPLVMKILSRIYPFTYIKADKETLIVEMEKGVEGITNFLANYNALAEDAPGGIRAIIAPNMEIDCTPYMRDVEEGSIAYYHELSSKKAKDDIKEILDGYDDESLLTVLTYIETGGSPALSGLRVYAHRNTIIYRINAFKKKTGFDLDRFDVKLLLYGVIKEMLSK